MILIRSTLDPSKTRLLDAASCLVLSLTLLVGVIVMMNVDFGGRASVMTLMLVSLTFAVPLDALLWIDWLRKRD